MNVEKEGTTAQHRRFTENHATNHKVRGDASRMILTAVVLLWVVTWAAVTALDSPDATSILLGLALAITAVLLGTMFWIAYGLHELEHSSSTHRDE